MNFYVYVIRSLKNKRFYVGSTNNLERRIFEHNNGKGRYTRSTRPFELVHYEIFKSLKKARHREKMLKGGQGREWLKKKFE